MRDAIGHRLDDAGSGVPVNPTRPHMDHSHRKAQGLQPCSEIEIRNSKSEEANSFEFRASDFEFTSTSSASPAGTSRTP